MNPEDGAALEAEMKAALFTALKTHDGANLDALVKRSDARFLTLLKRDCTKKCLERGPQVLTAMKQGPTLVTAYKRCVVAADSTLEARKLSAYETDLYCDYMAKANQRCRRGSSLTLTFSWPPRYEFEADCSGLERANPGSNPVSRSRKDGGPRGQASRATTASGETLVRTRCSADSSNSLTSSSVVWSKSAYQKPTATRGSGVVARAGASLRMPWTAAIIVAPVARPSSTRITGRPPTSSGGRAHRVARAGLPWAMRRRRTMRKNADTCWTSASSSPFFVKRPSKP